MAPEYQSATWANPSAGCFHLRDMAEIGEDAPSPGRVTAQDLFGEPSWNQPIAHCRGEGARGTGRRPALGVQSGAAGETEQRSCGVSGRRLGAGIVLVCPNRLDVNRTIRRGSSPGPRW